MGANKSSEGLCRRADFCPGTPRLGFKRTPLDGKSRVGPDDRDRVDSLLALLSEIQIPERYGDVIRSARGALDGYRSIDEREGFSKAQS